MLQYSLRALLLLTLAAAVTCGIFFSAPPWLGSIIAMFITLLLPIVLAAWVIYGRGHGQTFACGGLTGFAMWSFGLGLPLMESLVRGMSWARLPNMIRDESWFASLLFYATSAWPFALCGGLIFIGVKKLNARGEERA